MTTTSVNINLRYYPLKTKVWRRKDECSIWSMESHTHKKKKNPDTF